MPQRQREVPTARVRRGDVVVRTFSRGELRAVRSVTLTAPNLFGTVQVTRLAPLGAFAHEGDLIVEFDDSEVRVAARGKADSKSTRSTNRSRSPRPTWPSAPTRTKWNCCGRSYAVRRAELEVKRNELLSAIDAKKNELNLKEAQQRLETARRATSSRRRRQAEAEIARSAGGEEQGRRSKWRAKGSASVR